MKKLMLTPLVIASIAIATSCGTNVKTTKPLRDYKYEIRGDIEMNSQKANAVWFTDSIFFLNDTVAYKNSDGSITKIAPPYLLYVKQK